jgi:energy-coupling factor transporter ATP-binding protein EcfA2
MRMNVGVLESETMSESLQTTSTSSVPAPLTELPPAPVVPQAVGLPDYLGRLQLSLAEQLPGALAKLCNTPLARFQWKSRGASDTAGQLEVSLVSAARSQRAGAAQITLEFRCAPRGGAPVDVSVVVNPYRRTGDQTLNLRVNLEGSLRTWECAAVQEGALVVQTSFARPSGLPALAHLGSVWFTNQEDAARHGVASGVERIAKPIVHPALAALWPRYNVAAKKRDWALAKPPDLQADESSVTINAEEWAAGLLVLCLWTMLLRVLTPPDEPTPFDRLATLEARGLPPSELYWPRRAVDLDALDVQAALRREGLVIPWHVTEAACAALNAGKHVIFTGPPGCGKSKLAGVLATIATGREPLMVTASPAWSSGDLVGRYFPRRDAPGLEFRPGFFLRVIDEGNRWLVIDEFNRANIDECFGELFSVLADDVVELPFEEELPAHASDGAPAQMAPVRIVPARRAARTGDVTNASATTVDYAVGPAFRLIGTMNDADRSSLHQLSFALLRRFHIIRVEAPSAGDVEKVIDDAVKASTEQLMLDTLAFRLRKGKRSSALSLDMATVRLKDLFARDLSKRRSRDYTDLVQERVVGLATVQDIVRFVAEGLRGPSGQGQSNSVVATDHLGEDTKLEEHAQATCASFLAIAVALSVFPQLDALTAEGRRGAVRHLIDVFQHKGDAPILMRRIEAAPAGGDTSLRLSIIEHPDPTDFDVDDDRQVSIAEFLVEELCQQYRGTEEATDFRAMLVSSGRAEAKA